MEITDFNKVFWSILPEHEKRLVRDFEIFFSDESMRKEAADYRKKQTPEPGYEVDRGVAIIKISGSISKRDSYFSFLYGASIDRIMFDIKSALKDDTVNSILLSIDSPGGVVDGVDELSEVIFEARKEKPVLAYTSSVMASAAYWIGSSANEVIVSRTADVGSIGVYMVHYDWSEDDKKMGLKRTVISAGKYKALGHDSLPLSQDAKDMFQAEVDYLYDLFVDAVARNRSVESAVVQENMADGKVFIGTQAVESGLADRVGTFDDALIAAINATPGKTKTAFTVKGANQMEIKSIEDLRTHFSGMIQEIERTATETAKKGMVLATDAESSVTAERDRIIGLVTSVFGEDQGGAFKKLVDLGVNKETYEAIRGTEQPSQSKEDQQKQAILDALHKTEQQNPGHDAAAGDIPDFMGLVDTHMRDFNIKSKAQAIMQVAAKNPKSHEAYLKKVQPSGNA